MESLLLSGGALASPTMCRFSAALSDHKSSTTNLQEWIVANNGDGYFNIVNGKVRVA